MSNFRSPLRSLSLQEQKSWGIFANLNFSYPANVLNADLGKRHFYVRIPKDKFGVIRQKNGELRIISDPGLHFKSPLKDIKLFPKGACKKDYAFIYRLERPLAKDALYPIHLKISYEIKCLKKFLCGQSERIILGHIKNRLISIFSNFELLQSISDKEELDADLEHYVSLIAESLGLTNVKVDTCFSIKYRLSVLIRLDAGRTA